MPRLNIFENIDTMFKASVQAFSTRQSQEVVMHGVYIPGSISWNTVAVMFSFGSAGSLTMNLGLYSLNGSTLSMANSASVSIQPTAAGLSWFTMGTSTTQDITPGNWWFGFLLNTSGSSSFSLRANDRNANLGNAVDPMGGPFIRGWVTATTLSLPASVATSDCSNEGNTSTIAQK